MTIARQMTASTARERASFRFLSSKRRETLQKHVKSTGACSRVFNSTCAFNCRAPFVFCSQESDLDDEDYDVAPLYDEGKPASTSMTLLFWTLLIAFFAFVFGMIQVEETRQPADAKPDSGALFSACVFLFCQHKSFSQ
jgi:hypothetical protein